MSSAERTWRGSTLDARAEERRQRFVVAATELLGTQGGAGLTMRAACRAAGLSPRYFYESFESRDALAVAAYDAAVMRLSGVALGALAGDEGGRIRRVLDAIAELIEAEPGLGRVIFRETVADDALRDYAHARLHVVVEALLLALGDGERSAPLSAAQQRMRVSAIAGAGVSLFLDWTEGRLGCDRATFVDYGTSLLPTLLAASETSSEPIA